MVCGANLKMMTISPPSWFARKLENIFEIGILQLFTLFTCVFACHQKGGGHKSMGGCMIKCVPLERSVVGMSCVSKNSSSSVRLERSVVGMPRVSKDSSKDPSSAVELGR